MQADKASPKSHQGTWTPVEATVSFYTSYSIVAFMASNRSAQVKTWEQILQAAGGHPSLFTSVLATASLSTSDYYTKFFRRR